MNGTWFEINKDKMTMFEITGKCQRDTLKYVGDQTNTETSIKPDEGYKEVIKVHSVQEDILFKKTFEYDGSWFCKKDNPVGVNDCYLDYGR